MACLNVESVNENSIVKKTKICNLFLLTTLLLYSCSFKEISILSSAEFKKTHLSYQEIDYKSIIDFVIIPIEIEGFTYHFLFDTGAQTTVISEHLALKLNVKQIGSINTTDSQEKTKKLSVGKLNNISIGNFTYSNVGVIISDFQKNQSFSCLNIDGILGMNVIRLNNWAINYDTNSLTILDDEHGSTVSNMSNAIHFEISRGTPLIDLYVNGVKERFIIDTGKNGETISVSSKVSINKTGKLSVGIQSLGLFGKGDVDTIRHITVNLSDSADFNQNDVIIYQSDKTQSLIGTGFLKKRNSVVLFDFRKNILHMEERKTFDKKSGNYPFSPILTAERVIVGSVDIGFSEFNIGDTIVAVNEINFNGLNSCELITEIWNSRIKQETITLTVSKNNTVNSFVIPINGIGN